MTRRGARAPKAARGLSADGTYFNGPLKGHAFLRFEGRPFRGSPSAAVCECGHQTRTTTGGRKYARMFHGQHKADIFKIEQLKAKRAACTSPLERIAFDNDPGNGPIGLRVIAMTESTT